MSITITLGEQSENHVGMTKQGNGLSKGGFNYEDLNTIKNKLNEKNIDCDIYNLNSYINDFNEITTDQAYILIIRNGGMKFLNY